MPPSKALARYASLACLASALACGELPAPAQAPVDVVVAPVVQRTCPLFQGGRLWYLFQGSKAEREAALHGYEQSILVALREVSDSLVARERLGLAREQQARAVAAYEESVRLAQVRFWGGSPATSRCSTRSSCCSLRSSAWPAWLSTA